MSTERVAIEGGKYTLVKRENGTVSVSRHDQEEWRELSIGVGDKLVFSVFNVLEAAAKVNRLHKLLQDLGPINAQPYDLVALQDALKELQEAFE